MRVICNLISVNNQSKGTFSLSVNDVTDLKSLPVTIQHNNYIEGEIQGNIEVKEDIENEVREAQREKQDIIYSQKYCY